MEDYQMKITAVQVNKVKSESSLKAFVNITIDDELVIKGLKVVEGKRGLFVSMPCTKGDDGQYYDDVFPITKECREYVSDTVLFEYEQSDKPKSKPRKTR